MKGEDATQSEGSGVLPANQIAENLALSESLWAQSPGSASGSFSYKLPLIGSRKAELLGPADSGEATARP